MSNSTTSTLKPAIFLIASLALFFAPGIGDHRWVGLVAFLYIGLPWYILSVKDKIETKLSDNNTPNRAFRIHSPTLLIFGIICAAMGVGIDLIILHDIYTEATAVSVGAGLLRLFIGVPIFGFGAYFIYLSLGLSRNGT